MYNNIVMQNTSQLFQMRIPKYKIVLRFEFLMLIRYLKLLFLYITNFLLFSSSIRNQIESLSEVNNHFLSPTRKSDTAL